MKTSRYLATTAAVIAVASAGFTGAQATTDSASQSDDKYIIGGSRATSPWIVQLRFTGAEGDMNGCTGEQLNDEWVLTAKHCTEGSSNMKVHQSNSALMPGIGISADSIQEAPEGDLALIHLSRKAPLSTYGSLDTSYSPSEGQEGTIYGYGARANEAPATHLYQAKVSVTGTSSDNYGAEAVRIRGVDGASNSGDSGGPLVINGRIVGVCSTGDPDPGADINTSSNYTMLAANANWIQQTMGGGADTSGSDQGSDQGDNTGTDGGDTGGIIGGDQGDNTGTDGGDTGGIIGGDQGDNTGTDTGDTGGNTGWNWDWGNWDWGNLF